MNAGAALLLVVALGASACGPEGGEGRVEEVPPPQPPPAPAAPPRSPASPRAQAWFGDLHVHTRYSLDAALQLDPGGPDEAYRFARGEEIPLRGAGRFRRQAPLDFAAVTDHAEWLGEIGVCSDRRFAGHASETCGIVRSDDRLSMRSLYAGYVTSRMQRFGFEPDALCGEGEVDCRTASDSVWQAIQEAAHRHYEPGRLTTFVGYEWSATPQGATLHRNVIFRGAAVPAHAWGFQDAPTIEELFARLAGECTGDCQVLAIPHNPNLSLGLMFRPARSDGSPFTREDATLRAVLEPLVEIVQVKGSSECRLGVGTNDEACAFELRDARPVCGAGGAAHSLDCVVACDEDGGPEGCVSPYDYVRNGLGEGLRVEERVGLNPFLYGIIGSTDNHNGVAGATEEELYPQLARSGGLAGVWAEENTRESIWDALARREAFGTSGVRIRLRLFGGWDFPQDLHARPDAIPVAYAAGVPMGAHLPSGGPGAPRFLVWALKDPSSAGLEKVQIVKVWLERGEAPRNAVYDVVCSGGLRPDRTTHACPESGATVDVASCALSGDAGASELATTWTDPDFDAAQRALYYARVLQVPTCRWTTRHALGQGRPPPQGEPATIRERAWSSPIWYAPAR